MSCSIKCQTTLATITHLPYDRGKGCGNLNPVSGSLDKLRVSLKLVNIAALNTVNDARIRAECLIRLHGKEEIQGGNQFFQVSFDVSNS